MNVSRRVAAVTGLVLLASIAPGAESAATLGVDADRGSFARWQAYTQKVRQDPTLVRYYLFEEKKGSTVASLAGDGQGELTLLSNSPYGESRERRWWIWNSPLYQTFPEWTSGRWPEKGALSSGLASTCVVRSRFSGTADGIFTLAAWVRMRGGAETNTGSSLFNVSDGFGGGWKVTYQRAPWAPQGRVEFRLGTPKGPVVISATPFDVHVWHHLVCLWNGKALRLFVDGAPMAEKECAGPYTDTPRNEAWSQNMAEMDVGGFHFGGPGGERFDVDEVAIFKRALPAEEVRAAFEAGRPAAGADEQKVLFGKQAEQHQALTAVTMTIPNDTLGIFRRGAKIPARIAIPATAGLRGTYKAHFLLRDLRNMTVLEKTRKLTTSPQRDAEVVVDLAPERCGIYFLDLWLTDSAGTVIKRLPEEYGLAITVPLPPADQIPLSSPLAAHNISGGFPENRFLGFSVDRWIKGSEAYKKFGEIDPTVFGDEMDYERKSGLKVMFCLHLAMPAWAERAPGKKFVLKDMNIWADYCRQMMRQYKDTVMAWEIENEPNAGDLIAADEYVEFLKVAYATIKAEDPQAVVVGLCGCPGFLNWNDKVFNAGGAKFFDVMALHNYTGYPIRSTVRERQIERAIEQLVKYRGERVPVWNTETGFHPVARVNGRPMMDDVLVRTFGARVAQTPGQPPVLAADMPTLTEHATACWQIQSILLDLGAGCQKYFMLSGASHYHPPMNASDGQPTEIAPALAAVASVLIPSQTVEKLPLSSSADAGVIITQAGGRRIAALFSDETSTLSFHVDRSGTFTGMDMLGNPLQWKAGAGKVLTIRLGPEPVYVFDVPPTFAQLEFMKITKAPAGLPESGIMDGELTVSNPLAKPFVATLKPEAPKGSTLTVDNRIELKPQESQSLPFRLDGRDLKRRRYEIGFQLAEGATPLGKLSYSFLSEGTIRRARELAGSAALSDGAWWKGLIAENCVDVENVVHGQPIVGVPWAPQWHNAKDLSFEVRTAWRHDDAIFLRIDVTDDALMPAPAEKRGLCFQYDCIELFFDGRSLADRKDVYSAGAEQILVIPNAGPTAAPCDFWFAGKKPTVRAEFTGAGTPTGYWIEGTLRPEAGTALRIKAGTQFALDVLVDDTDVETAPRKAAMALHGVFNNASDPSKWGRYQLAPVETK